MTKRHQKPESTPSESLHRQQRKARKRNLPWLWIGLGVGILAAAAVLQFRLRSAAPEEISTAQAYEKYQQGVFFLDVRSQAEWNQAHIAQSVLIPVDELQSRLSELPRDRDIVVVCLSGVRSQEGVTILRQAGFSRASWMQGGLEAWQAAGYPLKGRTLQTPS
jgi:rhodanese-related sulfurtransferase